jgi:hypothetical protein
MFKKIIVLTAIILLLILGCSKKNITNNYYPSPDKGAIVGIVSVADVQIEVKVYQGIEIAHTYADSNGYFRIGELPAGSYSLVVKAADYMDYESSVWVPGGNTVSVDTIFMISIHDLIMTVWPYDGTDEVSVGSQIRIDFRRGMDKSSVEEAFEIDPLIDGRFVWRQTYRLERIDYLGVYFLPKGGLATGTTYNITIDTMASDFEGVKLSEPYRFSFTTEAIQITATRPENRETWVDPATPIDISFNTDMDAESAVLAFKMIDSQFKDVNGIFYWDFKRYMHFVPDTTLTTGETYTITIDTNAKAVTGGTLKEPYNFWFKTRPY